MPVSANARAEGLGDASRDAREAPAIPAHWVLLCKVSTNLGAKKRVVVKSEVKRAREKQLFHITLFYFNAV